MIKIFKSETELGFSLFDVDSNKFLYGEVCGKERLVSIVNSFPEHVVMIFIEKAWQDDIQEIFFLIPHLQDLAQVIVMKKIVVSEMIASSTKPIKKKRSFFYLYISIGVILGALLLIPTSTEYKNSVLVKAQSVENMTAEFLENQPDEQSKQLLYTSIDGLHQKVRVEAVTYSVGTFKIIFSSANGDLQLTDLTGFEKATLVKVSTLGNEGEANIHIYELEGSL